MTRTLNTAGRAQATLAPSALRHVPLKLDPATDRPHVNAAMPTAPQDYQWEHLKKPARFA